ncbi:MAG: SDR family oxidoreductase [Calditrichaeota bacterium]|jgi:uncharacterized protein YbjT (DUF2867 family)|nr:SDR family oxidoreductase [Calditrichota bacterium]MBT7618588.1 SDR family oxidoreductase [Calditrichota bacterium]MBT7787467.1 SDR family oxidoreductase [Calditrichota bacterium]
MILITGATGTIGSNLTFILARNKIPVRALVRDKTKISEALSDLEIEFVEGDFTKPDTLDKALEGVDSAFLVSPGDRDLVEFQANFIDAAKKAKLKHLVKISSIGTGPEALYSVGRWHHEVEKRIEQSGIPFTFVRAHSFMQNFFVHASFIQREGAFLAPMGDGRIPMIDVRDIVMVLAVILTSENHEGKTYEITGPQAISYSEAADVFTEVLGKPVKFVDTPLSKTRENLLQGEWPEWMVDDVISLYRFFREGHATEVTDTVEAIIERKPGNFEQFVKDYAPIFKGEDGTESTETEKKD